MSTADFRLELFGPGKADVYLACDEGRIPWSVVERLDGAGLRVVGDVPGLAPDPERLRRILKGCAGMVAVPPTGGPGCVTDGLALLTIPAETRPELDGFLTAVQQTSPRLRSYAFMVGRLERDFRHAREAIRGAVEAEAGIPCLWADD